jgi:hypothetical protein
MNEENNEESHTYSVIDCINREYTVKSPCGKITLTVGYHPETKRLRRTFIERRSDLNCDDIEEVTCTYPYVLIRTISELLSLCLEYNIPKSRIERRLVGHRCNIPGSLCKTTSCSDAIGQLLKKISWEYKE